MVRLLSLIFVLLTGCSSNNPEKTTGDIREPAVAGTWYPASKEELQDMIEGFLSNVRQAEIEGQIYGIIAPHAGYPYSGQTAAFAFKTIQGKEYETVIIIGPYHGPKRQGVPRPNFRGVSVYPQGAYRTPLGLVEIDSDLANKIISSSEHIKFIPEAHIDEHSVESEIPFLQVVLDNFKIVPIVMIDHSMETCKLLAEAIVNTTKDKNILIVASSDFYHGYDYEECKRSVKNSVSLISNYDISSFYDAFINKNAACGGAPITVCMLVCDKQGAEKVSSLYTTNSGDVMGKKTGWLVGYGSFVITGGKTMIRETEFKPLDEKAQKELLRIARKTIEEYLKTGKIPEFTPKYSVLEEKRGVFVTITTKDGRLRGCIGQHETNMPLYKLVPDRAIAAGFRDSRFPSLSESELENIKIKLSIYLSHLNEIKDISEYKLGVHGIIMVKGNRGATYLPEVPLEVGWTKEETLEHLCIKAGLSPDAWREGAKFYVYETQIFSEH